MTGIALLLPPSVASAESFGEMADEPIFPGEEAQIARATPGRRAEFAVARRCAREALAGLGHPPTPIGTGPQREPLWPAGVAGAITHTAGYRGAAVARVTDVASLGIDAEPNGPLPPGVQEIVTVGAEPAMLAALTEADPSIHWGRLLFSAKESVYKAWFPLTGRWLDFADAELTVDREAARFTARILVDGSRPGGPPLTSFEGRYRIVDGLLLTAVTVPV